MANEFGGIGYNREAGFPASIEAYSIGLGVNIHLEKKDHDENESSLKPQEVQTNSQSRAISSSSCLKKRKLKQANLLDFFVTPRKQRKFDHK